tara:strand:- start:187 stop:591 length:405 start_codon:yes stop_codon:yes gene_type:complete
MDSCSGIEARWASHLRVKMTDIIKKFIASFDDDADSISIDALLDKSTDRAIYEKWIQLFNSITPFNIKDALRLIDSSFKMSKRDALVLLAYVKFFEQKLGHLKNGVEQYGAVFGEHKVSPEELDNDENEGNYYA